MNSIFRQVGCSLNLFVNSSFPTCTTIQELRQIQSILRKMKNLSSSQFASETGCLFKCSKIRYKIKEVKEEDLTWKTEWISEVDQCEQNYKTSFHSSMLHCGGRMGNLTEITRPGCQNFPGSK